MIVHKPDFLPKDSSTHVYMRTHGRQTMVTETSKTTNYKACFFYNIYLY